MDYSTLIAARGTDGSIKNWVNDDRVPSAVIVQEAESWINRRLRCREMVVSTAGTATASASSVTLPSDFLDPSLVWVKGTNGGFEICQVHLPDLVASRVYDGTGALVLGTPYSYAIAGTSMQFAYRCYEQYVFDLWYYREIPALSTATGSTTNFLTNRYPNLLRAVCLAMANQHRKDVKQTEYWEAKAIAEIQTVNQEADKVLRGADIVVRAV